MAGECRLGVSSDGHVHVVKLRIDDFEVIRLFKNVACKEYICRPELLVWFGCSRIGYRLHIGQPV